MHNRQSKAKPCKDSKADKPLKRPRASFTPQSVTKHSSKRQHGNGDIAVAHLAATLSPASAPRARCTKHRAGAKPSPPKRLDVARVTKRRGPKKPLQQTRKVKRVRFADGPLKAPSGGPDGHPTTEGRVAKPVRVIDGGFTRGSTVTKKDVRELDQPELLGNEQYAFSIDKLKKRVGLLPSAPPMRPYATKAKAGRSDTPGGAREEGPNAAGGDAVACEESKRRRKRAA